MERIGCPETSLRNYYYSLRNSQEQRSCQINSVDSLFNYYSLEWSLIMKFRNQIFLCDFRFPHGCAMAQVVRRRSVASEAQLVRIALVFTIPSAFHTHSSVIDPLHLTNFFCVSR